MKRILIYGDSNLWGYNFPEDKRLEDKYQWSNMLGEYLGSNYTVIVEGLPGRVAGDIEDREYRKGKKNFESIFRSHTPIDYIIIALGTNDLSNEHVRTPEEIYEDLMWYKDKVKSIYDEPKYKVRYFNEFPEFIYVLPGNFDYINDAKEYFDINCEQNRQKLIQLFKDNCIDKYVVLNDIELYSGDGMHYTIKGQQQVFEEVKKVFNNI